MWQKNIGVEKAFQKIKHFCAYQERNHREVKEKLYSFGLYKDEVELLLSQLIETDYLNEERYAIAFAGGKFRVKNWGRVKIRYALQQQKVSDYCIRRALQEIDTVDYLKTLQHLYDAKKLSLENEPDDYIQQKKTSAYLLQKGYEYELIKALFSAGKS